MAEVKKSDFIYFQNEFLQDIKKLDIKFNEKISQIITTFQNSKLITDQKFQIYNDKISSLRTAIESNEEFKKVKTELENFKKKITEENIKNSNKIFYLERDLSDACFKYDTLFSSVVGAPGLIGKGCKYPNLKNFYELTDRNILEFQSYKDKNNMDLEKYKNKIETLIGQFKLQSDSSQNSYFSFCNEKIAETKNKIDEQFRFINERISNMRMENGKYSYDLIKKTEELKDKIHTINNITNIVEDKLKEEMKKFQKYNNELIKIFDSQKEEFKIIKIRFTELSEFIKDVRFMRNIKNNMNAKGNNKDFDSSSFSKASKLLSKKLNFNKSQKITEEEENIFNNKENNNDIENLINIDDNNKIILDNYGNNSDKEIDNEDKKKYNIKLKVKEKEKNSNSNKNLNLSGNNQIINNNYTFKTNLKENKKDNIAISQNKSRNNNLYNNDAKTNINSNKKFDYLKTDDSSQSTINQNYKKNLFIRTQSQFSFNKNNKKSEYIIKIQKTQDNFYHKNKILKMNKFNLESNSSNTKNYSVESGKKFKKIWEKEKNFDELLKLLDNNHNSKNNNNIFIEAYKYLNTSFIKNEEKINEIIKFTKINFEKIYKKMQVYIDLTNSFMVQIKMDSIKKKNVDMSSARYIYTNSEINMPLLYKVKNNNNDLSTRNNIKKNIENITLKHQKISSGKILSIIEPYLIKKFKSN